MSNVKNLSTKKLLEFGPGRSRIGPDLVTLVRGVVQSNHDLTVALTRLRHSYKVLLAGAPATDAEEILWQVDGALNAERSSVRALDSFRRPRGA